MKSDNYVFQIGEGVLPILGHFFQQIPPRSRPAPARFPSLSTLIRIKGYISYIHPKSKSTDKTGPGFVQCLQPVHFHQAFGKPAV